MKDDLHASPVPAPGLRKERRMRAREKLTNEEKVALALDVLKRARPLHEICAYYQVSHTTAYNIPTRSSRAVVARWPARATPTTGCAIWRPWLRATPR